MTPTSWTRAPQQDEQVEYEERFAQCEVRQQLYTDGSGGTYTSNARKRRVAWAIT